MKPIYLLPFLACGCFLGSPSSPSRPVEYIDLSPRAPEVERPSHAPSGVSQETDQTRSETDRGASRLATPVIVNLYSADWCGPCKQHEAYWQAHGWKGKGFTVKKVTTLPDWVEVIPVYHWNGKTGPLYVQCGPEQLQSAFDQTPGGK